MLSNNNTEQQLQELSMTIDQAKARIKRKDALYRLLDNKDFQEIIDVGYLRDEPARLVNAIGDVNMQGDNEQKHLNRMISGISALTQYLQFIERQGLGAEEALKGHEQTREEILREELENAEVGAQV